MRKSIVSIAVSMVFLLLITCLITTCKYDYDSFKDVGIWRKIENGQYYRGYEIVSDTVYFITESDNRHIIRDADPETFRVCQGTDYAKDKNRIYYIVVEKKYNGDSVLINRTENADVRTFKYIGADCAADVDELYYKGLTAEYDGNVLETLYQNFQ